jgi:cobalt-precorrin 5A hydrolase
MNKSLGIWMVRKQSEMLAITLQDRLGGELFRPWLVEDQTQIVQFSQVFHKHGQWIILAATGIAVRFLNGLIQDKHSDPAVVVLDEAARYAIALLAGHEGGANQLAYRVANIVNAVPVITTATEALKPLVVGIGCRKGVSKQQIETAVFQALGQYSLKQVREVATIDLKAEEPGLIEFCSQYDLPLRVLSSSILVDRSWVTQPSDWVKQTTGLNGVCEPCALIACGRGKLLVPKMTLDGVAVAIVQDIDWITK